MSWYIRGCVYAAYYKKVIEIMTPFELFACKTTVNAGLSKYNLFIFNSPSSVEGSNGGVVLSLFHVFMVWFVINFRQRDNLTLPR
jgi:hypothetical protein